MPPSASADISQVYTCSTDSRHKVRIQNDRGGHDGKKQREVHPHRFPRQPLYFQATEIAQAIE